MHRTSWTLYVGDDSPLDDPEDEGSGTPLVEFDPGDEASLQRAREAVKARFSLSYLPVLCSEPEPTLWSALRKAAGRWLDRAPLAPTTGLDH